MTSFLLYLAFVNTEDITEKSKLITMRFKQLQPAHFTGGKSRGQLRLYSPSKMTSAFLAATSMNLSIRKASQKYGVPYQTLRDRVAGEVDAECVSMGRDPGMSLHQEARLVNHLKDMAALGYGYTRQEVVDLAGDFAVSLNLRTSDNPFSLRWFYSFMKRWPDLRVLKPRALEIARAKGGNKDVVNTYFTELEGVLKKYDLTDKPHVIFNVDEKGIQLNHSPPCVVASTDFHPPAVTSGKSSTITILGCGSAVGYSIPPYFIFPGKKMQSKWMEGCSPGAVGTVSESGWSNSDIFLDYLKNHFLTFVPRNDKILLLLDGHKSHVSVSVIEWAQQHNILIHLLPAHTSHFLQPMYVGIYGPFQKIYNNLCHKKIRMSSTVITKDEVCQLACSAYVRSSTPENLQAAFKKTGIYPFNRNIIDNKFFLPSQVFQEYPPGVCIESVSDSESEDRRGESGLHENVENMQNDREERELNEECESDFFEGKMQRVRKIKSERQVVCERNTLSKVVSGKVITECEVAKKVREHASKQCKMSKAKSSGGRCGKKGKSLQEKKPKKERCANEKSVRLSQEPGPSSIYVEDSEIEVDTDDSGSEIRDEEKCCLCGQFTPEGVKKSLSIKIVNWAKCDKCGHWTHLIFCTHPSSKYSPCGSNAFSALPTTGIVDV